MHYNYGTLHSKQCMFIFISVFIFFFATKWIQASPNVCFKQSFFAAPTITVAVSIHIIFWHKKGSSHKTESKGFKNIYN